MASVDQSAVFCVISIDEFRNALDGLNSPNSFLLRTIHSIPASLWRPLELAAAMFTRRQELPPWRNFFRRRRTLKRA